MQFALQCFKMVECSIFRVLETTADCVLHRNIHDHKLIYPELRVSPDAQ